MQKTWYNTGEYNEETPHLFIACERLATKDVKPMSTSDHTTVPMKRCSKCHTEKPATAKFFFRNHTYPDGFEYQCKECNSRSHGHVPHVENAHEGFKTCSKCGEVKPKTRGFFCWSQKDGIHQPCKSCGAKARREWVKANPELDKERQKQERIKHKDRYERTRREYLANNGDKVRQRSRDYFIGHRQENAERCRTRYWRNREEELAKRKSHYREHAEEEKENRKVYRSLNPEKIRLHSVARRTRKAGLPYQFTVKDKRSCLNYWGYRCAICGRPAGLWHTLAMDHWIPLTDPRPDNPGTVAWNIVPLCHGEGGCNNSKFNRDPIEWLTEKLGKRKAAKKLAEIESYFESTKENFNGQDIR